MRANKFNAKKTVVDNITFDSRAEAKRYGELKVLFRAQQIQLLELQPEFELHPYGCNKPIGKYRADFAYFENGKRVVEDVKGVRTPLYRWKKKHVEAEYKVQIVEV